MKVELNENLELAKAEMAEKGKKAGAGVAVTRGGRSRRASRSGDVHGVPRPRTRRRDAQLGGGTVCAGVMGARRRASGAIRPQQDPGSGHARARKDNRIGEGGRGMAHTSDQLKQRDRADPRAAERNRRRARVQGGRADQDQGLDRGQEGRRRLDGERGRPRRQGRSRPTVRRSRSSMDRMKRLAETEPGRLGDRRCGGRFHRGPAHALRLASEDEAQIGPDGRRL